MALLWIDAARDSLAIASNNYAKLQKELDKYNKIFQTYVRASPDTQIRAASVMRQALNEYNSLKAQQEWNALKIYEAQNRVNYYNNNPAGENTTVVDQTRLISSDLQQPTPQVDIDTGVYEEAVPAEEEIITSDTTTPWASDIAVVTVANNQNDRSNAILNAVAKTATGRALINLNNQNKVRFQQPVTIQRPKYQNTSIRPASTQWTRNIRSNTYWQWNIAGLNTGLNSLTYSPNTRTIK